MGYQGIMLYIQYVTLNIDVQQIQSSVLQKCAFWVFIEVTAFYLQIAAAILYLTTVQIRGVLGLTDRHSIESRFKYDAIEYYEEDIHWLGFSLILLGINLEKLKFLIDVHSEKDVIKDDQG